MHKKSVAPRVQKQLAQIAFGRELAAVIGGVENSQERTNGNGEAERHPPDESNVRTNGDGVAQRRP